MTKIWILKSCRFKIDKLFSEIISDDSTNYIQINRKTTCSVNGKVKIWRWKIREKKQTHSHMCSRFKVIFALTYKMQVQTTCLPYGNVFSNSVVINVSNIANLERNAWWRSLICDSLIYFYIFACYDLFLPFCRCFFSSSFISFRFFC